MDSRYEIKKKMLNFQDADPGNEQFMTISSTDHSIFSVFLMEMGNSTS